jgi:hypothetical protein
MNTDPVYHPRKQQNQSGAACAVAPGFCREPLHLALSRTPFIAFGLRVKSGSKNYDIVGGLDFMATFAAMAGVELPDRER